MTDLQKEDFEVTYKVLETARDEFSAPKSTVVNDVHYMIQLMEEENKVSE